jgi:transcription initiation factor TFIIIB Brf1 subunit/transcription initiation factor TFIIB
MAACVFYGSKINNTPISPKEVSKYFNIDVKKIT